MVLISVVAISVVVQILRVPLAGAMSQASQATPLSQEYCLLDLFGSRGPRLKEQSARLSRLPTRRPPFCFLSKLPPACNVLHPICGELGSIWHGSLADPTESMIMIDRSFVQAGIQACIAISLSLSLSLFLSRSHKSSANFVMVGTCVEDVDSKKKVKSGKVA
jgi:hypothetical protein